MCQLLSECTFSSPDWCWEWKIQNSNKKLKEPGSALARLFPGFQCFFSEQEHIQEAFSQCLPPPPPPPSIILTRRCQQTAGTRRLTDGGLGRVEGHSFLKSKANQPTLWLSLQSPVSPPPLRDPLNSLEDLLLSRWFLHMGCDICQTCLLPGKITHLPQLYPTPPRAVYCWLREWGGREKRVKEKEHAPRPREILPYSHERWASSPWSFRVLGEIVPASESFFSNSACFENQSPADLIYTPYPPSLSYLPAPYLLCLSFLNCTFPVQMEHWNEDLNTWVQLLWP